MSSEKKGRARSDRPPPELKKERDAFIETFFKKGAQLTEELLKENQRLRSTLAELEAENAKLRAQVASDDAIRELLRRIDGLEREKNELLSRYREAEAATSKFVDQYSEVESELANLANLYVASYQLHSSLSLRTTVRHIKELLGQLVGARAFAIFLATDDGRSLEPIASEGVGLADLAPVGADDGIIADVFATGVARIETGDLASGSRKHPLAVVPMTLEDKTLGVLAVFSTLEHKSRFLPVDFELFKLLGAHAGAALVCAKLFADAEKKVPGLSGFLDLGV